MKYILVIDGKISTRYKYNVWDVLENEDNTLSQDVRIFCSDDNAEFAKFLASLKIENSKTTDSENCNSMAPSGLQNMSPTAAYWKMEAMKYANALVNVMDSLQDHDIQAETGLPQEDCNLIAEVRAEATSLCCNFDKG